MLIPILSRRATVTLGHSVPLFSFELYDLWLWQTTGPRLPSQQNAEGYTGEYVTRLFDSRQLGVAGRFAQPAGDRA
jgi:hypothetical protein